MYMGTSAQVRELPLMVDGDDRLTELLYQEDLVVLPPLPEELLGLFGRPLLPFYRVIRLNYLLCLLLNPLEVLRRQGPSPEVYVVEEAVLYGGADGELGVRPKPLDRLGQYVRGGVPEDLLTVPIVEVQNLNLGDVLRYGNEEVKEPSARTGNEAPLKPLFAEDVKYALPFFYFLFNLTSIREMKNYPLHGGYFTVGRPDTFSWADVGTGVTVPLLLK